MHGTEMFTSHANSLFFSAGSSAARVCRDTDDSRRTIRTLSRVLFRHLAEDLDPSAALGFAAGSVLGGDGLVNSRRVGVARTGACVKG